MPGRWLPPLALAHAAAFALLAHAHYIVRPPSMTAWILGELMLSLAFWRPAHAYWHRVLLPAYHAAGPGRWLAAVIPAAVGLFAAAWWGDSLETTFWKLPPALRPALAAVLFAAHAFVAAAGVGGLLAATVAVAPPAPALPSRAGGRWLLPAALGVAAAAGTFAVWYVGQERTVYHWDFRVYWGKAGDLADRGRDDSPVGVWRHVRQSTRLEDYGPMPVILPASVMAVGGRERRVYVAAVAAAYLAGVVAAVGWAAVRLTEGGGFGVGLGCVLTLTLPLAWAPVLRGYPDLGGVALGVLALAVVLGRPAGGLSWRRVVGAAFLLAGMALYRRWYAFFVTAMALAMAADAAWAWVRGRGWRPFGVVVLTGTWIFTGVALVAVGWVRRAATADYASDYFAYRTLDPFADRLANTLDQAGPAAGVAAALGFVILAWFPDTRRAGLFIGGMVPVMLAHFLGVQNFGPHHLYLLLPAYLLLPTLGMARLLRGRPASVKGVVVAIAGGWGVLAMAAMFAPKSAPLRELLRSAVSPLSNEPLARDDLPELRWLLMHVERTAAATGGTVAVVASSPTLNGSVFESANDSLGASLIDRRRVLLAGEVDRVSDFPAPVLRADYLVVGDPPQTHLRPEEQQCVVITAESLHSGRDIGAAYERVPGDFPLAGGVTARVYRRVRRPTAAELAAYCERLRLAHPDRPAFYTPPAGEVWSGD